MIAGDLSFWILKVKAKRWISSGHSHEHVSRVSLLIIATSCIINCILLMSMQND